MVTFDRLIGAQADLNELEYVSTLHQTSPTLRANATVSALDITRYLKSRYGIIAEDETIQELVWGLGGGPVSLNKEEEVDVSGYDEEESSGKKKKSIKLKKRKKKDEDPMNHIFLDLAQLMTIITMPTIARAAHEWCLKQDRGAQSSEMRLSLYDSMAANHKDFDDEFSQYSRRSKNKAPSEDKEPSNWRYSLRPMPKNMIHHVLKMVLAPIVEEEGRSGESQYSKDEDGNYMLSRSLLKALLMAHGELDRAQDSDLIDAMLELADGSPILDQATWVRLLSSDLDLWKVESEDDKWTTEFFDVFQYESHRKKTFQAASDEVVQYEAGEQEGEQVKETSLLGVTTRPINQIRVASYIDFAVDSQRSVTFVVFAWVFYILTSLTYVSLIAADPKIGVTCDVNYGCTILQRVWSWLILATCLAAAGLVILVPISLGNGAIGRSRRWDLFVTLIIIIWTALFYTIFRLVRGGQAGTEWGREQTSGPFYGALAFLCLAAGCFLLFLQFKQLMGSLIPKKRLQESPVLRSLFIPSFIRGTARCKRAATRKVNRALLNAFRLHPFSGSTPEAELEVKERRTKYMRDAIPSEKIASTEERETMLNFVQHASDTERCGGFFWTWKRIYNTELFADEGVWLQSRLYVIQAAQLVISVFLGFFFFYGTELIADQAEESRKTLDDVENLPQWVLDFVPTRQQVYYALYPASSIAMLVVIGLVTVYIPSTVNTILKLRSGVLPSLHDPLFFKYRKSTATVYVNLGNAIFAMFGASLLFFVLIGGFLFLCIWPFTQSLIKTIAAWAIALIITILLKTIMVTCTKNQFFAAFCRTRALGANYAMIMLECWHVGLGAGILVGRLVQFLLASAFWIGRIDVPFLSNDVRFGGYHFDTSPTSYRKDILLHDTHRHPFMLRLGSMYLMKLAYGDKFSSPAGTCWRNLFVVALMPWIKRYRMFENSSDDEHDDYAVWVKEKSTFGLLSPEEEEEVEEEGDQGATTKQSPGRMSQTIEVAEHVMVSGYEGVKGVLSTAAEFVVDEYEVAPEQDAKKKQ